MEAGIEPKRAALVARVRNIVLTPRDEWNVIAAEPESPVSIFSRYVMPLAAIGPVAGLIGGQVFGYGAFGFSYRPGLVPSIVAAVVAYAIVLAGIWLLAFLADYLAPRFGGVANRAQAFKLVAYGSTASLLAGLFGLVPSLGVFGLLGLYSLYQFYTGVGPLMQVPGDKGLAYTAFTVVAALVLWFLVMPLTAAITGALGLAALNGPDEAGGEITLPGGGSIDTGRMDEMSRRIEDAASGRVKPVETTRLAALLPRAIGDWTREETESTAVGELGSTASATYARDDRRFTLRIIDMSAMGPIAGMGAAMGIEQKREDDNGYERTTTIEGRLQTESWRTNDKSGKFATVLASRFLVEAEGQAETIDELKSAVAAINPNDLEDLAER